MLWELLATTLTCVAATTAAVAAGATVDIACAWALIIATVNFADHSEAVQDE